MTLTLILSPEREALLTEQAQTAGLPLDEYALRVLDDAATKGQPPSEPTSPPQTLAEMLAGHIGTVASGRGDLSQDTGQRFTQIVQEKHKARRL